MQSEQIMRVIRTQLEKMPDTSTVSIKHGFRVHSNTSPCYADLRMVAKGLTVLVPYQHVTTLVEPITRPSDGSPAYTRFLADTLHWNPTTGDDGTTFLKLRRGFSRLSSPMAERVVSILGRVFKRDAELRAMTDAMHRAMYDEALMEALAAAAMELADDPEFQAT
jgi:hypothetical protein